MSSSTNFSTTRNGTTLVNVNDVIGLSTTMVIDPTTTPYIDNIIILNPTITTFLFKPGNYKLVNVLHINVNKIQLVGMSCVAGDVQIVQTMSFDAISLQGSSIVLQDISVTCTFPGQICLTGASINNTIVSGCFFAGAPDTFAIYYSGPSNLTAGSATLSAYFSYALDCDNIFRNNVIYTTFSGDSVAFCLQHNTQLIGNVIRGGRMSVYMCRTCNVYNNTIMDSSNDGMYISFPSDFLSIVANKIYNPTYSGITMKNQLEHGSFTQYDYNIAVNFNSIFGAKFYGIELNDAMTLSITNNTLTYGQTIGIYSYSGTNLSVSCNKIAYFNYGVYMENSTNSTVKNNNIMSVYPDIGQNGVKLTSTSSSITVGNNKLYGTYQYDLIADSGTTDTVTNNTNVPNYTLENEKSIFFVL